MPDRPNILFITTDQQRWDTLHAAGNGHIFTPHLNWLCDTGVRFSRAYSDCPVCMPARATIMTGMPGYRHGAVGNDQSEPIRGRDTLPGLLTAAGYQTRAQGKMHFHPMRNKFGFEEMELAYDYYRFMRKHNPDKCGAEHGQGQNEQEPIIGSTDENHTLTRWVVDRSIDFLETRDEERPFFLWTSISKPHPPFDPSLKFWELYRDMPMPEPVYGDWSQSIEDVPVGFSAASAQLGQVFRYSKAQLERSRRAYYACITEIDANLGRLFTRMRELGLLKNTWIIFTADHGEMLGDHHLNAKGIPFEGSAHIPLLMRAPGEWDEEESRGTVCDSIASLQDVMPTCLDLAGVKRPKPKTLPGNSLRDLAEGKTDRKILFGQCGSTFMVLKGKWKYCYTSKGGEALLFNLEDDPYETRNLAAKESKRCAQLHAALVKELKDAGSNTIEGDDIATSPAPSFRDIQRWSAWPGFHSTGVESDLLH